MALDDQIVNHVQRVKGANKPARWDELTHDQKQQVERYISTLLAQPKRGKPQNEPEFFDNPPAR